VKRLFAVAVGLFCLWSSAASAVSEEPMADAPTRTIKDYIKDFVDVPEGATDWQIFGKTKEISVEGKGEDGLEFQYYKPEFPPELLALDGKRITVKGFMFPLDSTEEQKFFLFGPFPLNCPFQYHVGPSLVIEAYSEKNPVEFSYDPMVIEGTLELVPLDPQNSAFYRLRDVRKK